MCEKDELSLQDKIAKDLGLRGASVVSMIIQDNTTGKLKVINYDNKGLVTFISAEDFNGIKIRGYDPYSGSSIMTPICEIQNNLPKENYINNNQKE